jgi:HAD superfamily hydrolase (TIGR01549 family)
MDDTIFDHSLTCRAAIASLRSSRPFLRRRPLDELWRNYLQLLDDVTPYAGGGGTTPDEARKERWRRIALRCGQELGPAEVADLSQDYRARYQKLRRAVPGARELLERLHNRVQVVVVTNNEVAEQEEKVRFLGVGPLLDGLVVSEAVGTAKPDRQIFEVALATVGVRAEQATMLGDSWTSDVLGAEGAGVRPVWFNRFGLPRPGARPIDELRSLRPLRPAQELLLGGPLPSSGGRRFPAPSAL